MGLEDVNQSGPGIGQKIKLCLRMQSLTGIALAMGLLVVGPVAAYSALFGSLAAFIPALVFAVLVATKIGNDSAAFLRAAVLGEAVKFLLIALIGTAVFLWVKPLAAGWFFTAMILVVIVGYLGLIFSE